MEQIGNKKSGSDIIPTPVWVLVVRIAQVLLSFVVLGLCGAFVHYLYADQLGFAIVCCIFTWIISIYNIIAEKAPACRRAYNTWATLSLDLLMIIFWLAAMGAVAAYQASFTVDVKASCTSDGSLVNSGSCNISAKRASGGGVHVASKGALSAISGAAGVAAVIVLLYVASFAYVCHFFRIAQAEKSSSAADPEKYNAEMITVLPQQISAQQSHPLLNQPAECLEQQQQQHYQQPQATYSQPQYHQQQTGVPYDPYVSQTASNHYTGNTRYSSQELHGEDQPVYIAHSTPAPGPVYRRPSY